MRPLRSAPRNRRRNWSRRPADAASTWLPRPADGAERRDWYSYLPVGRVAFVNEQEILHVLTPTAERLVDRHLATTKEWFPHDYVPWGRGRDHDIGHQWTEEEADLAGASLTPEVRSALHVN